MTETDARDDALRDLELGEPEPGEGLPSAEAFAPPRLLEHIVAAYQHAPVPLILGGVAIFGVTVVATFTGMFLDLFGTFAQAAGQGDPLVAQAMSTATQMGIQLVAAPLRFLILVAMCAAVGRWAWRGETGAGTLVAPPIVWLRSIGWGLAFSVIQLLMQVLVLAPPTLFAVWRWQATQRLEDVLTQGGIFLVGWIALVLVPATWVDLSLQLGLYSAVLDRRNPFQAIRDGWRAAQGLTLLWLLLVMLLAGVVRFIGGCLCGLPSILLEPALVAAYSGAWLTYARSEGALEGRPIAEV